MVIGPLSPAEAPARYPYKNSNNRKKKKKKKSPRGTIPIVPRALSFSFSPASPPHNTKSPLWRGEEMGLCYHSSDEQNQTIVICCPICFNHGLNLQTRIGRHEALLPIFNHNYNKNCDNLSFLKIKDKFSREFFARREHAWWRLLSIYL